MSLGNIGFSTSDRVYKKKSKKKSKPKKKKSRRKTNKRTKRKTSYDSGIGIPTMDDLTRKHTIRKASAKERRKAHKKQKNGRVIGIDMDGGAVMSFDSDIGDPLEMKSIQRSSLNTDITKINASSEFDYNLGDTGFGLKQEDLNKDKKLDKMPLTKTTFKTPFGDISRTQIPLTSEKGDLERNKKGIVKAETVTSYENVNPAFQLIGKGIQGLNTKIQTQIEKEKEKRRTEELIAKAVKNQKPNRPEEDQYCVQVQDRDTGNVSQFCYTDRDEAELAIRRARSEGLIARKV